MIMCYIVILLLLLCYADGPDCKTMIGAVDYSWLFTYAVSMFARYANFSCMRVMCY